MTDDFEEAEPKPAPNYEVGYGKPPPVHRFQPGQSGNPKGRPARNPTTGDVFRKVLKKPVVVSEGGRKRKISTEEALFLRVRRDALEGDPKARRDFLALMEKYAPQQLTQSFSDLFAEDERLLRDFGPHNLEKGSDEPDDEHPK